MARKKAGEGFFESFSDESKNAPSKPPEKPEKARDKVGTTVYMERALVRRARFTVAYYPGLTLSGLFEAAIEREVAMREKRDNDGEPYPEPDGRPVHRGRPLKKV
jgi:hypothetical protein